MEKPTTLLGRTKPSTGISGNVKSFVVGYGSGTVDLLLSSSLGLSYTSPDVTSLNKATAPAAIRLRVSELQPCLCTGLLYGWHQVTYCDQGILQLLFVCPRNWNCWVCKAVRLLLYSSHKVLLSTEDCLHWQNTPLIISLNTVTAIISLWCFQQTQCIRKLALRRWRRRLQAIIEPLGLEKTSKVI